MTTNDISQKLMDRVRALLTQAEHPNTSAEEAEAFTAKAAALIARYGIDAAMLADRGETRETVTSRRFDHGAPYGREKSGLLSAVARSLRCYSIQHGWGRTITHNTIFGFPSDLERVAVLYSSLLIQAQRDVARAYVPWGENVAAFRRSWWVGFAAAVGKRLSSAERAAATDTDEPTDGGRSVALVLVDRKSQVDAAVAAAFPKLNKGRRRQLSGSGMRDGYQAGQRADLGDRKVTGAAAGQIGGAR